MANAQIAGGSTDGYLRKYHATTWAGCVAATPTLKNIQDYDETCRTTASAEFFWGRTFLTFDVSSYAGATITAAHLHLYGTSRAGTRTFKVYYLDWGTDLAAGDWPASLGTAATATVDPALGDNAIDLTNLSNILTSNGRFVLALDDESTEPSVANYIQFASYRNATEAYRPVLDITYSAVTAPTLDASQVDSDIEVTWS